MERRVPLGVSDFRVRAYEADGHGALSLPALCDILQEAADRHASQFGAAVDQVAEAHGETWVLHRLAVRVHRAPRWRETLRVETWPCGRERLFTVREYCVLDAAGTLLAEAVSAWLVMDLGTRRLARTPRTPLDWHSERGRRWHDAFATRLPAVPADAPARELDVRRGDIDVNGHVNHVCYVSWVLEAAPEALWHEAVPVFVDVEYLAEALAGERVRVRCAPGSEGVLACEITHAGTGRVLARALTRWAPRPAR